jgi:hypothetical protein
VTAEKIKESYKYRDFETTFLVAMALDTFPVSRLTETWKVKNVAEISLKFCRKLILILEDIGLQYPSLHLRLTIIKIIEIS